MGNNVSAQSTVIAVFAVISALVLIGILVAVSILTARTAPDPLSTSCSKKVVYAVPFVCGTNPSAVDNPAGVSRVRPGNYTTHMQIHNPHKDSLDLRMRVSLSFPPEKLVPGLVSDGLNVRLQKSETVMVDCQIILGEFNLPVQQLPPYISGVLNIRSEQAVVVYQHQTVDPLANGAPAVTQLSISPICM